MQTQKGEYHVKSEAETGVMPLPAKEYQGLPATPRSWERDIEQAFSQDLRKEPALPTSSFQTASL